MANLREKYIGNRTFYKEVQKITIPILLQSLLTVSAQLIDNVMVGRLGEDSISAVASSNQLFFVIMVTLFGVSAGGQIYIAQYHGAKRNDKVTKSFQSTVIQALIFAFISFTILSLFSDILLSAFVSDSNVLSLASSYLKYISLSIFPFAFNLAFSTGFRSIGKTKIPMFLGFISVISNTILNFILIFGVNIGYVQIASMGVEGAGLATLLARIIEMSIYILVSLKLNTPIKMNLKNIFKIDTKIFKIIFAKSLPLIVNEFFWSLGQSTLVVIYVKQTSENLASFQISQSFASIFFSLMGAVGAAVAVIVGNKLGSNNLEEARSDAYKLGAFGGMVGVVCGFLLFLTNFIAPFLYDVDPDIMSLSRKLIVLMSFMFPIYYITASAFFILRSGGDAKSVLIMDAGFSWFVYIPIACFVSYVLNFSMLYIYMTIQFLDIVKLKVAHIMVSKEAWVKNLTQ